jgi:hypothetical protein
MPELSPASVLDVLRAIDRGDLTIIGIEGVQEVTIEFTVSNGWKLFVFNDAGEWDYLESALAPNGSRWAAPTEPGVDEKAWPEELMNFHPSPESQIRNYRWPEVT